MLAQGPAGASGVRMFDTGGTAAEAASAASAARRAGAQVILGPLLAGQVPTVIAAVQGDVPVVTFSNDSALRESGAFLLGITPRQTVASILGFAGGRGIRRVAVIARDDAWGRQVRVEAEREGPPIGIATTQLAGEGLSAVPEVIAASPDGLPDAVLFGDVETLARLLPSLREQGIQALAAFPELDHSPDFLAQAAGTWIAVPDPEQFNRFSQTFEQRMGTRPGLIAALAYDAVSIFRTMLAQGGAGRAALLAADGFDGVCGRVRFRDDGSARRALAILELGSDGVRKVAAPDAS